MSFILNIETSTEICSVAIGREGKIVDFLESREEKDHARVLTLLIDNILKKNHVGIEDIVAVAVSEGPGSYTGLRIGVSTAKGLAYGLKIPLLAVSSLKAMAKGILDLKDTEGYPENTWLCPMIEARRMEVYLVFFNLHGEQMTDIRAEVIGEYSFNDLFVERNILFFGTGSAKCKKVLTEKNALFLDNVYPRADYMVSLSDNLFRQQNFVDIAYFEPFYLKEFVATIPKNKIFLPEKQTNKGRTNSNP